jgi:hypothetical protein
MSLTIQIDDKPVRDLLKKIEQAGPSGRTLAAKVAARTTQDHFRKLASRRHRGGNEDWYGRAAGATTGRVSGENVVVSIAHEGIALRRFGSKGLPGGVVKPGAGKTFLTIPAKDNAQARRRSARDIDGLHFRRNKKGDSGRLCDATGRVFFWLVKQSVHKADPSVLPTAKDFAEAILPELSAKLDRM